MTGVLIRSLFRRMPRWLVKKLLFKMGCVRPQVSFLPLVADMGSIKPIEQPSLYKTLAIHEERTNATAVV